jgi:non-specific serine/threonine protein kinase
VYLGELAWLHHDLARAQGLLEEALLLHRRMEDPHGIVTCLNELGKALCMLGSHDRARGVLEESLALCREIGDRRGEALALDALGTVALAQGDGGMATNLYEGSLALARELGDQRLTAFLLCHLGGISLAQGGADPAAVRYREALAMFQDMGNRQGVARALQGLAGVAAGTGDDERAVGLFAAVARIQESVGAPLLPKDEAECAQHLAALLARLGAARFEAAWAAGRRDTPEGTVAEVAAPAALPSPLSGTMQGAIERLTRREVAVLRLLADGKTDREIADALCVSRRTAATHVAHVYGKLGVGSRAAAAAWAVRHGLA